MDHSRLWTGTCEVTHFERRVKLGVPAGKVVQIDELKITSLRAHYGRSIEENSRKFFIVTVQDRTEATMIRQSHIQEWIESGTTIVSDCWRLRKLGKYGYGQ